MAQTWYVRFGKRGFDLLIAVPACVLLSPLFLLTAVLVRWDSPGPELFVQERAGRRGRTFRIFKFRTMTDRLRTPDREIIGRDADVTRVGYWLRRFKIDELPQLWNVIRGEMSLIGPRPGLPVDVAACTELERQRLLVRPGLTGLAQTHGNIHLTWQQRWQYDAQYVEQTSLWLDLQILWRTVAVVLAGEHKFLEADSRPGGRGSRQLGGRGSRRAELRDRLLVSAAQRELRPPTTYNIPTPVRIALAGSVSSSRAALESLIAHEAELVGVLELDARSAANVSGFAPLRDLADRAGVPCVTFENINRPEVVAAVRSWSPDLLFVVGLSQLVKSELLAVPTLGCVGFHPTWLPRGRGRAPLAWLTYDGEPGAATFFLMDEGADSGPILVQEPFLVGVDDYAADVERSILAAMRRGLDRWLPRLIRGEWTPIEQDHSQATYHGRRAPEDGLIDWHAPAERIARLVRAASRPHPGAYTYIEGFKLIVWRAGVERQWPARGVTGRILEAGDGGLVVQTGEGLLRIEEWEYAEPSNAAQRPPALRTGRKLGYAPEDEIFQLRQTVDVLQQELAELRALMTPTTKGLRRCA